jgi:hypothetical protein
MLKLFERWSHLHRVFLRSILHFRGMENTTEGGDYWLICLYDRKQYIFKLP